MIALAEASLSPRSPILGVSVSAINMDQAVSTIDHWIRKRHKNYVCVTPLHSIIDCNENPALLDVYNDSGMTTPDGMSVVWLLRMRGSRRTSPRTRRRSANGTRT